MRDGSFAVKGWLLIRYQLTSRVSSNSLFFGKEGMRDFGSWVLLLKEGIRYEILAPGFSVKGRYARFWLLGSAVKGRYARLLAPGFCSLARKVCEILAPGFCC